MIQPLSQTVPRKRNSVGANSFLAAAILLLFFPSEVVRLTFAQDGSLDGYAYNCDGVPFAFGGTSSLMCDGGFGNIVSCGTYSYDGASSLSGTRDGAFSQAEAWTASNLYSEDSILISFTAVFERSGLQSHCIVVSQNYRAFNPNVHLGLKCPTQNAIIGTSFEDNHASLGVSGDVAFRSKLEIVQGNGDTIVRDSFGVYIWFADGTIKFYFGAQQGRDALVATGTLDANGLFIEGKTPQGPCVYDGQSFLTTLDELPQADASGDNQGGPNGGGNNGNVACKENKKATFMPRPKKPDFTRRCKWLQKSPKRRKKHCKDGKDALKNCPKSCEAC